MPTTTKPDGDKASRAMVRDSKKRLAKTNLGKLYALEAEQTRWQRKETIARNKLIDVRRKLCALAHEMARATVETEWTGKDGAK